MGRIVTWLLMKSLSCEWLAFFILLVVRGSRCLVWFWALGIGCRRIHLLSSPFIVANRLGFMSNLLLFNCLVSACSLRAKFVFLWCRWHPVKAFSLGVIYSSFSHDYLWVKSWTFECFNSCGKNSVFFQLNLTSFMCKNELFRVLIWSKFC